jgi:negative regulator of genetic competence, sporulation and motility
MELTPIGKERLEVSLTPKDMARFRLNAEKLDYSNTETRRAVWTILDTAKRKTGFDAAQGKIRIDALPSKAGGCVIFITKTEEGDGAEDTMSVTKESAAGAKKLFSAVYGFSEMSALLRVCLFLSERGFSGESAAWAEDAQSRAKSRYYLELSLPAEKGRGVCESMLISEYGKKISGEHAAAYIREHCRCLCEKNAVGALSAMA